LAEGGGPQRPMLIAPGVPLSARRSARRFRLTGPEKVGRTQRNPIADELVRALFFVGDFEIASAPVAVSREITGRAPSKEEHDKSRADNLSHGRKSPLLSPPNVDTTDHLGRMFDTAEQVPRRPFPVWWGFRPPSAGVHGGKMVSPSRDLLSPAIPLRRTLPIGAAGLGRCQPPNFRADNNLN
jgi:hypothetical protein